jgi:phage/plasmid-associated DNA primase
MPVPVKFRGAHPICQRRSTFAFYPKLISRNSVPVCYDPRAKCPRFKGELLAPLAADDMAVLQKIFGMYLGGINFLQMIIILQGVAESGKSQLAIVARELIGEHNCAELRVLI